MTIEPSARLRYAHLSMDGYAETGGTANFAAGDRDVSLWSGRAQLAFPTTIAVGHFSPRVGIEAWGSDSETVSGTLLGQAVSFDPGDDDDDVTGFVGATGTTRLGSATFVVDGESISTMTAIRALKRMQVSVFHFIISKPETSSVKQWFWSHSFITERYVAKRLGVGTYSVICSSARRNVCPPEERSGTKVFCILLH